MEKDGLELKLMHREKDEGEWLLKATRILRTDDPVCDPWLRGGARRWASLGNDPRNGHVVHLELCYQTKYLMPSHDRLFEAMKAPKQIASYRVFLVLSYSPVRPEVLDYSTEFLEPLVDSWHSRFNDVAHGLWAYLGSEYQEFCSMSSALARGNITVAFPIGSDVTARQLIGVVRELDAVAAELETTSRDYIQSLQFPSAPKERAVSGGHKKPKSPKEEIVPVPVIVEKYAYDVFLSYSHPDKGIAARLIEAFRGSEIKYWIDEEQIIVGMDIPSEIEKGLKASRCFVAVLTPRYLDGAWALEELRTALSKQINEKRVIVLPALFEECNIPSVIAKNKYSDFREVFDQGLDELLRAVRYYCTGSAEAPAGES